MYEFVPYVPCNKRSEDIKQIEKDIIEINEIFKDLNYFVCDQQKELDLIDNNITTTKEKVQEAEKELKTAEKYQKKNYKLKTILLAGVITTITVPLSFVIGGKVAIIIACGTVYGTLKNI